MTGIHARSIHTRLTPVLAVLAIVAGTFAIAATVAAPASATAPALTWSAPQTIDPPSGQFVQVSCPSATFCGAIDEFGGVLTWNGSSWSTRTQVDSNRPASISCASSSFCALVDDHGDAATFNGSTWTTPVSVVSDDSLRSVSCASPTMCVAFDESYEPARWNGSTWSVGASIGAQNANSATVSCASTTTCTAVDASGNAESWNGSVWSAPTVADAGEGGLSSVSCPSTTFCLAVDRNGGEVTFNGSTWSSRTLVADEDSLRSVSCTSASFCVAIDNDIRVDVLTGTTWSTPAIVDNFRNINSVSCATASVCVGLDDTSWIKWNGTQWATQGEIDGIAGSLRALSCPSPTFCAVLDNGGYALTYNGASWSPRTETVPGGDTVSEEAFVSCTSSTFCLALETTETFREYNVLTWNGSTWSTAPELDDSGGAGIASLSCVNPSFCVAGDDEDGTGDNGGVFIWQGSSWSARAAIDSNSFAPLAVSCASISFCVAVDADGAAFTYNGSTWSGATTAVSGSNGFGPFAVSCPTTTFCAAVGDSGDVTYASGTWSTPPSAEEGSAVSCASVTFCGATGGDGNFAEWDGSAWQPTSGIPAVSDNGHISCPSTVFCMTLTQPGAVIVGTAPAVAPGVPTGVSATAGDMQATVSWTAPVSNGGSAITGYDVQYSSNGGATWTSGSSAFHTSTVTTQTVTGLTNASSYVFQVAAINGVGMGAYSTASASVMPAATTVPDAPTGATAAAGDSLAVVAWNAPASNGGSAITGYDVQYSSNSGASWTSASSAFHTSTATSQAVTGLVDGTAYEFRVAAINAVGTGSYSSPSAAVTPAAGAATPPPPSTGSVPTAPTNVSAVAGNGQATVSWTTPGNDGGSAITSYLVQYSSNSGQTWTSAHKPAVTNHTPVATTQTVTGLTNGTSYVFRVAAINAAGLGAVSAASAPVTPNSALGNATALTSSPNHTITIGQHFPLSTTLTDAGQPVADAAVELLARSASGGSWSAVRNLTTDATGTVTTTASPNVNLQYEWSFAGDSAHGGATSAVFSALVHQALTVHATASHIRAGHVVQFYGLLVPAVSNSVVYVQRRINGEWVSTGVSAAVKGRTLPNGTVGFGYVISYHRNHAASLKLRIHVRGSGTNLGGSSRTVALTVR